MLEPGEAVGTPQSPEPLPRSSELIANVLQALIAGLLAAAAAVVLVVAGVLLDNAHFQLPIWIGWLPFGLACAGVARFGSSATSVKSLALLSSAFALGAAVSVAAFDGLESRRLPKLVDWMSFFLAWGTISCSFGLLEVVARYRSRSVTLLAWVGCAFATVLGLAYPYAFRSRTMVQATYEAMSQALEHYEVTLVVAGYSGLVGGPLLFARRLGLARATTVVLVFLSECVVYLLIPLRVEPWTLAHGIAAVLFALALGWGERAAHGLLTALKQPVPPLAPRRSLRWSELPAQARRLGSLWHKELPPLLALVPYLEATLVVAVLCYGREYISSSSEAPAPYFCLCFVAVVSRTDWKTQRTRFTLICCAAAWALTANEQLNYARWVALVGAIGVTLRSFRNPLVWAFWIGVGVGAACYPAIHTVEPRATTTPWNLLGTGAVIALAGSFTRLKPAYYAGWVATVALCFSVVHIRLFEFAGGVGPWSFVRGWLLGSTAAYITACAVAGVSLIAFRRGSRWCLVPALLACVFWIQPERLPLTDSSAIAHQRLQERADADDPAALLERAYFRKATFDYAGADSDLSRAIELGYAPALHACGVKHERGGLRPRNLAVAQEWFRKAAEAGYEPARERLEQR